MIFPKHPSVLFAAFAWGLLGATLQAHGEGYTQEAVRLESLGSPHEIKAFVDGMFKEFDDDTEQLVQANLGAMEIPEPWKSISAKYFMRENSE